MKFVSGSSRLQRDWLVVIVTAMMLAGCKTQPHVNAHIESVNAEYRQLEDYVYVLEEENAKLQQELDAARTLAQTGELPGAPTPPPRGGLFRRSPPAGAPPRRPATESPPGMDGPVIELPGETPPARTPGARSTSNRPEIDLPPQSAPAETPPNIDPPRPSSAIPGGIEVHELLPVPSATPRATSLPTPESTPVKPSDKKVTHLFLNPALTGASDFDGQPGDDGLRVVVEPRNAGDQFVPEAGALSVVLLDPERDGDAARVARWDFDLSATRQMLAASSSGRGLALEMPWPAAAPAANRLKLFVRYETADGRRLQTDREIFVTQPGQAISRWTPRAGAKQGTNEIEPVSKVETAKSEISSTKSQTSINY